MSRRNVSAVTTLTINPYLQGNFGPVRQERDDSDLEVTGSIPPELNGLLIRNGPNPVLDPDPSMYHWFIGDGMLHGIELSGGKARYRNRWVRTPQASAALGEAVPDWGKEPEGLPPGPANTSVVPHAGRIFALVEVSLPTQVSSDLSTLRPFDFDGRLTGSFTAHPKFDPTTGEMLFFGYEVLKEPYLNYHVVDANGVLVKSQGIEIPRPVMMHTFIVTATRVVWLDLPVVFDVNLLGHQPFPFTWRPENGARVGVMSRSTDDGEVVWIDVDPCYVYHEFNAYDDADGNTVMDVVVYPHMFETDLYGPGASSPSLQRWTVDPVAGRVAKKDLDDLGEEFPRINDRFSGLPYRYGYSVELDVGPTWWDLHGLRKHDLLLGRTEHHDVGRGRAAMEPVFIPARDDNGEDAGWVVSVVYDAARDASDVIVVDATDFRGPPAAVIHLRQRVPFGFHGAWISGASLG
jgi:carotenoid cleavage dioxygenase